jgi:hypothetical protein
MDELTFYSTQSKFSDPGKYSKLFNSINNSINDICNVVHNLVVHQDATLEFYGFKVPEGKKLEANTRYIEKILEIIIKNNHQTLNVERKPEERFIGSCRDFALLTCSILRYKKIPARIRCGFANYFHKDWYSDHWVCEYYDKKDLKWKLVDSELGKEELKKYQIDFDHTNILINKFLVAGNAWKFTRENKKDSNFFGVHGIEVKGFWFIKADVIRDLAALNKIELLPWDYTEYIDDPFDDISKRSKEEIDLIDNISNIISEESIDLKKIIKIYKKNIKLQIIDVVKSYSSKGPIKIRI